VPHNNSKYFANLNICGGQCQNSENSYRKTQQGATVYQTFIIPYFK
jgi:hypothetical protein